MNEHERRPARERRVTGRLLPGDRVRTVDGDGVVVATYVAVHDINPAVFHIVELDDTKRRRPVRDDQLEFVARQLAVNLGIP